MPAYSCFVARAASSRTCTMSEPMGACGPCFSRMPMGRMQVLADFSMAWGQAEAVSSSHRAGKADGICAPTAVGRNAAQHANTMRVANLMAVLRFLEDRRLKL